LGCLPATWIFIAGESRGKAARHRSKPDNELLSFAKPVASGTKRHREWGRIGKQSGSEAFPWGLTSLAEKDGREQFFNGG